MQHRASVVVPDATGRPDDVAAGDGLTGRGPRPTTGTSTTCAARPRGATVTWSVPATRTGEADDAVVGGAHRGAGGDREVDPPVTGLVLRGGRVERTHDGTVDGAEPAAGAVGRGAGGARGEAEHRDGGGDDGGQDEKRAPTRHAARFNMTRRTHGQPRGRWNDTTTGKRRKEVSPTLPVGRVPAKGQSRRTPGQ